MTKLAPKLMKVLSEKFGENKLVKTAKAHEYWLSLSDAEKTELEHPAVIWSKSLYKHSRGFILITLSDNPQEQINLLKSSEPDLNDVKTLVKLVKENTKAVSKKQVSKTSVKSQKLTKKETNVYDFSDYYREDDTYDESIFDTSDDDISDIMRSL